MSTVEDCVAGVDTPPPYLFHVFYNPSTGAVVGWSHTNGAPSPPPGHAALVADGVNPTVHQTHRVDVARLALVEMTEVERKASRAPKAHEVGHVIFAELSSSDKTQIPDFPISDKERAAWREYRHKLRRLSDLKDPAAMVKAWPAHPDGADPVAHLRKRI